MNSICEEICKKLENYRNFDQGDNADKFLDLVDELVLSRDSSCIPELLKYFDDNSEYSWVFESMSGAIEHFDREDYVRNLLINLDILFSRSQNWAASFVFRIFNDQAYLDTFRKHMHLADKSTLLKLFNLMEQESPGHRELIADLRHEFETKSLKD